MDGATAVIRRTPQQEIIYPMFYELNAKIESYHRSENHTLEATHRVKVTLVMESINNAISGHTQIDEYLKQKLQTCLAFNEYFKLNTETLDQHSTKALQRYSPMSESTMKLVILFGYLNNINDYLVSIITLITQHYNGKEALDVREDQDHFIPLMKNTMRNITKMILDPDEREEMERIERDNMKKDPLQTISEMINIKLGKKPERMEDDHIAEKFPTYRMISKEPRTGGHKKGSSTKLFDTNKALCPTQRQADGIHKRKKKRKIKICTRRYFHETTTARRTRPLYK